MFKFITGGLLAGLLATTSVNATPAYRIQQLIEVPCPWGDSILLFLFQDPKMPGYVEQWASGRLDVMDLLGHIAVDSTENELPNNPQIIGPWFVECFGESI